MPNKNYFAQLSPRQKAELFLIYTGNGMYNLQEIMNHYNSEMERAYGSTDKDMVARMHDVNAPYLLDEDGNKMTHRMASGEGYVFPTIQRNDNGDLENYEDTEDWGAQRAIDRGDTLQFKLPSLADYFSKNYKTHLENPNMFDIGGDTNSDDNGVNEYISKKIAEMRARALEKSRTAIAPYKAPGSEKDKERSISHFNAWARTYRDAGMRALVDKPAFVLFENPAYGFIDDEGDIIYDEMNGDNVLLAKKMQARSDPNKARIALNMMAKDFEDEAHAVAAGGIPVYGSNCAYNVTTWHGPQYSDASNVHFANEADNGKNGWVRIPVSEAREGDTIQGKDEFGVPGHMMLLDGFDNSYGPNTPLFNYSRGGNESYDLVKHGHYVNPEDFNDRWFNAFRFVGTPADSLRWKQEYENMNQKN